MHVTGFVATAACCAISSFAIPAFAQPAPPRSMEDVAALLESHKPDAQAMASHRAELERQPPSSESLTTTQIAYWNRRVDAAEALGLFATEMDARRKLAALSPETLIDLASSEYWIGNYAEGLRLTLDQVRAADPWRRTRAHARMVAMLARQGDIEGADEHFKRFERDIQVALDDPKYRRSLSKQLGASLECVRGSLNGFRGRLVEAEAQMRQGLVFAYEHLQTMPIAGSHLLIDLCTHRLAEVLSQNGRFIDAELLLRKRLEENLKRVGRVAPPTLASVNELAGVYAEQGRFGDAARLARAGIDGMLQAGAPTGSGYLLDTRLTLVKAYIGQQQWKEAAAEYLAIRSATQGAAVRHHAAVGSAEVAIALVRDGKPKEALETIRPIAQGLESSLGRKHYRTGEARGVLAMALAKSGNQEDALGIFRDAIATMLEFDAQADQLASAGLRRLKLVWIVEAFLELLVERYRAGDASAALEAFQAADAARALRVQGAVTAAAARAAAATPELADLVRKEQDLGHEAGSLYKFLGEMLQRPAEQQLPKVMADMRTRIERIGAERSRLLQDIDKRFPAYANLISPKPPALASARQALREDEALVALYSAEDASYLWAMKRDGDVAFAVAAISRKDLQSRVNRLLEGVRLTGSTPVDALPRFDVALAHELYKVLVEPIAPGWTGAKSLVVVPHGPSAMIPFAALSTTASSAGQKPALLFGEYRHVRWLARDVALAQFPSVNALVTLRAQPPGRVSRQAFAGFGDPIFSARQASPGEVASRGLAVRNAPQTSALASARLSNLPRLPDTADEIRALAQTLGAPEADSVFLQRRANEKEVKGRTLSDRRIVAFATHGLVAGDLDGLTQPALALTAPDVAGIDGDGLLTMEEILSLKLDADWVILSACNTAAGEGSGAEAVSGLGRAFFYAGSRSLLVSNWPVETVSAVKLTTSTIEHYAKASLPRAEALRRAMLELLDRGEVTGADAKPLYAYAHPLFWAPFSVVGEGN